MIKIKTSVEYFTAVFLHSNIIQHYMTCARFSSNADAFALSHYATMSKKENDGQLYSVYRLYHQPYMQAAPSIPMTYSTSVAWTGNQSTDVGTHLAVNPLAIIRGKESKHASNINGLPDTVVRAPGGGVLVDLLVGQLVASRNIFLRRVRLNLRL